MIRVDGNRIVAETATQTAVFCNGVLQSLVSRIDGERYLYDTACDTRMSPVEIVYPQKRVSGLGREGTVQTETVQYNDTLVILAYDGWFGHGELRIEEDCATGDLCVTPSVHCAHPGVKACRWELFGIREDLWVTVPFMQGFRAPLDAPVLRTERLQHLPYPSTWEDNFVAFGNASGGFWLHCRGARNRFKYLHLGHADTPYAVSVDTENTGAFHDKLSAGGVTWRLNVYSGDWTAPVLAYRDVLRAEPMWEKSRKTKPEWFDDIRLAVSWCPTDIRLLEEIKRKIDPNRVLIHVPHWRDKQYDQCYPDFTPSADGAAFIAAGQALGFHMAPHCNSLEIDPSVDEFELVRDFRYRDADTADAFGWGWGPNGFIGVPETNLALRSNRRYNVMTKIHPALPAWQHLLAKNVKRAVDALSVDTMFLDVSLCMWNLTQSIVNDATPMDGMEMVFDLVSKIGCGSGRGLTLGGEGLNEMLMFQHFAQGHSAFPDGSAVDARYYVPVNHLLMGELCHLIGYHGADTDAGLAAQDLCDRNRGFIPTLISPKYENLINPDTTAYKVLERACASD